MRRSDYYVLPRFMDLQRDGEQGHNALLMGMPGTGKTTLLQYLAVLAAKGKDVFGDSREKQAGIWRARRHDKYLEFFSLGIGRLMLPAGSNYDLLKMRGTDRQTITLDDLESEGIDYDTYSSAAEIAEKLEPGKILAILYPGDTLEETAFYAELFRALVNRKTDEWVHLSIDEAGDLLPPYTGDSWKIQKDFVDATADFRKRLINSEFGCHWHTDLDPRLWGKLPYHIYKMGAKRMKGETPRLKQETINNTGVGEGWITYGAFFDKFLYPPMQASAALDYSLQTISRSMQVEVEDSWGQKKKKK